MTGLSRHADVASSTTDKAVFGGASLELSVAASGETSSAECSPRSLFAGNGSSELFRASLQSTDSTPTSRRSRRRPSLDRVMSSTGAKSVIRELNRLKFDRLGLYGRDLELATLHKAYEKLRKSGEKSTNSKKECAGEAAAGETEPLLNLQLISGASGTGKSAIVKEFRKQLVKRERNLLFVSGKFDQHLSTPYAAFISAFSQLCSDAIQQSDPTLRTAIYDAVGTLDHKLLLDLIPTIGELVYVVREGSQPEIPKEREDEFDIVKSEKKRKFLLQRFLAAVATPEHKLVIFLDDLQWVDPASLVLLEMILTEDFASQENVFIIGAHRDDEVDDQHPFSQTLSTIQTKRKQTSSKMTVENLSPEAVHGFITELFNTNYEETEHLARIVYTRVQGNVFYLLQLLSALRDGGFLHCNLATMKWTWDASCVQKSTVVAGNVLTILMDKMDKLPKRLKGILQIAACLGSSFDEVVVTILDRKLRHFGVILACADDDGDNNDDDDKPQSQTAKDLLERIAEEGLLEKLSDSSGSWSYCFAHDQIQLAANALLDTATLPQLKLEIGRILYENKTCFNYDSLLFTIVDMLNEGRGTISGSQNTQLLIDVNFEAGTAAVQNSAFGASVR